MPIITMMIATEIAMTGNDHDDDAVNGIDDDNDDAADVHDDDDDVDVSVFSTA